MKIQLPASADKFIGAMRLPTAMCDKLDKLANAKKVSRQEVIRAILDRVIDEVEV